jgi:DNA-binding GntR family transcriptional regulator
MRRSIGPERAVDPRTVSARGGFPQDRPAPRYSTIEALIASAIREGRLAPGLVLTEEPIARLFGTSRTPARKALSDLLERGLLERFDGRGLLVPGSGGQPVRERLTADMLGVPEAPPEPQPVSAERIAQDFEAALTRALPFGSWRISEPAAAEHYEVSRTVIRELLSRLQDRGIVRKDLRSHWVIGPLTARDVAHYFAVRGKLEPLALFESAPRMPPREIEAIAGRLAEGLAQGDALSADALGAIETDLHVTLLSRSPNPHLLRMIRQSQIALVVNRVFASFVGTRAFGMAIREHAMVLEFIMRGAHEMAARALEEHLRLSAARTRQRLMAVSVFPRPGLPRYLLRQDG